MQKSQKNVPANNCHLKVILLCTYRYVDYSRLEQPSDDIEFVLTAIAKRIGALIKGNTDAEQKINNNDHYPIIAKEGPQWSVRLSPSLALVSF